MQARARRDVQGNRAPRNAYFPLFIPQSFLAKEAQHVERVLLGAPETAVVTRTAAASELEEPLVVRPTSETIIYARMYRQVDPQSWRDLPVLINQWANIVRWEISFADAGSFLRTTEFLWQEGHTAHATEAEAETETLLILGIYRKSHGRVDGDAGGDGSQDRRRSVLPARCAPTSCEALMQDNKALQAGTSHNLGQNFAKAFDVPVPDQGGRTRLRLEHLVGCVDTDGGRVDHDAQRRQGTGLPAAAGAVAGGDRADLEERRRS